MMLETPRKSRSATRTPLLKSPLSPDGEDTYEEILQSRRRRPSSSGSSNPHLPAATKDSLHWFRARQQKWKTASRPCIQKVHISTPSGTSSSGNKPPTVREESETSKNNALESKQLLFGDGAGTESFKLKESSSFGLVNNKTNTSSTGAIIILDNNFSFGGDNSTSAAATASAPKTTTTTTSTTATALESTAPFGEATTYTTTTPFSFSTSSSSQSSTTARQQKPSSAPQATFADTLDTTTATTTAATETSSSTTNYRDRLIAFYKEHNPSKVDSVDATLQKFHGREEELFAKLQAKYTTVATAAADNYLPAMGSGPICFLKFSTGHSIQVELFADKTPFAAENFRCLCTGEKGPSYHNCIVHRIVPNFCIQAGDYTAGNGTGGKSIYQVASPSNPKTDLWGNFEDETPFLRHDAAGLLSMANNGPNRNSSQFFITLRPLPHLNGKHVVFGRVVTGMDAVEELGKLETDVKRQRPIQELRIVECGQVNTDEDDDSSKERKEEQSDDESSSSSTTSSSSFRATDSNQKDRSTTSNPFARSAASTSETTPFGSDATFALTGASSSAGSPFGFGASKEPWSMSFSSKEGERDAKTTTPFSFGMTQTEKMVTTTTSSVLGSSFGTSVFTQMPNFSAGRTHSGGDDNNKKETSAFSFGSQTKSFNLSVGSGNSSDDKAIPPSSPILSIQSVALEAVARAVPNDANVAESKPSTMGSALDPMTPSKEVAALESSTLASNIIDSVDATPSVSFPSNLHDLQGTPSLSSQENDSLALSDTSSSSSELEETAYTI